MFPILEQFETLENLFYQPRHLVQKQVQILELEGVSLAEDFKR